MARSIEQRTTYHNDAVRRSVALALAALMSAGCALDLDGLPASAGSTGAGGAGGASVSTTSVVSSSGTTAPCTPTGPEICDDGIDNDCNRAADCEDPACQGGFVCVPAIPSGWTAVAFSAHDRPACPGGYAASSDVVSAPTAAAACVCTCTEQKAASCTEGNVAIAAMGAMPCPASPNLFLKANGSSCSQANLGTTKNALAKISPLPPVQGTCNGAPQVTILPVEQGRSCAAAAVGVGCAAGGACVSSPSAPFVSCVEHDGVEACPAGFKNGYSVGASAMDTRGCSPCSCGTSATCSNPKLTLYKDNACTTGALGLPASDSCDPVNDGNGSPYPSYKYTATVTNGACQKTTDSTPNGSLVLVGERTICCQ
jgi:hypothetical protein